MGERVAVIGLGNTDRADDAAGILAVRALGGRVPEHVTLMEGVDPVAILDQWEKFDAAILVDAVRSGASPGTVHTFDGRSLPSHVRPHVVTLHGFHVRDVIALGEVLGRLPRVVRVVGIEAAEFTPGAPPDTAVERAVEEAAQRIMEQIALIAASDASPDGGFSKRPQ